MSNAGCINAISCDGCLIQTLQQLDSANIGVGVQFTAPDPLDDKKLDYIKYTDKCGCTCCLTGENEILIYATQGVIKNLTLTNDEANEVVNVKRTDLFGSNRKKTVVRYKTGSYPTSITDGTLAVEELVKNQYETNGFDVSGLEDGTTYYFSVFAVAQDDTIIIVQGGTIVPSFGRKPTANTKLYLPMQTDLVDHSGNNVSITNYGISLNTTILSSMGVGYFKGSGTDRLEFSGIPFGNNFTISRRERAIGTGGSGNGSRFATKYEGNSSYAGILLGYQGQKLYCGTGGSSRNIFSDKNAFNLTQNTRVHRVFVRNGNSRKSYRNKTEFWSGSSSSTPGYGVEVVGNYRPGDTNPFYGYMSNFIIEDKSRTTTDINTYYDKLKSKYGLS